MLISQTKKQLITNSLLEFGETITDEQKGKGRKFVSRFIEAGVAHYQDFGDVLITKETLNKFIDTMVGCPVIIQHKEITEENADKERVGVVSNVYYNENDGWFYCDGVIWDKQAIDLVKNQGWSVSCTYDFVSDNQEKTHNGKKIDMEFINGNFVHLALVPNPRYERANIVINSKDKWITIKKGDEAIHLPVDEQNKIDTKKIEDWKKAEREIKESLKENLKKVEIEKPKEVNKKENEILVKKETEKAVLLDKDGVTFWCPKRYFKEGNLTDAGKRIFEQNKSKQEKFEKFEKNGIGFKPSWESEKAYGIDVVYEDLSTERLNTMRVFVPKSQLMENGNIPFWLFKRKMEELQDNMSIAYKSYYDWGFKVDVYKGNIEEVENSNDRKNNVLTILDGEIYEISESKDIDNINNGKAPNSVPASIAGEASEQSNSSINENGKEVNNNNQGKELPIMAVLEELKDFIKSVVTNADEEKKEKKVENEDKRKIIDEIGGMLDGKIDEELWRTVMEKMEDLGYEPSEKSKADNKAKNEDGKDEEKKEKYEKEKEVADVENKCGKAKNSMDKAREIVFGGSQPEFKPSYVSREDRLKLGDKY